MTFDIDATTVQIDRMVSLLRVPLDADSDYLRRINKANGGDVLDDWRRQSLRYFESLSDRLRDPSELTDNDAHHLLRWMDWDMLLTEAGGDLPHLASEIQTELLQRESASTE